MEHNGKKVELKNTNYGKTQIQDFITQAEQPERKNRRRTKTSEKFAHTLAKGKVWCSSYTGLWNPAKFENFDGNKYKKDK